VSSLTPPAAAILDAARAIMPDVLDVRRRLHRIPELGLQLPLTQAVVVDALGGLGLEPSMGRSVSSVVASIDGAEPGRTILLRADMDALPLSEDSGLPFASEHEGRMHACGHDTHVAMLLGAARLLIACRATWSGRVLLMFQPGEEGFHGARFMLEEGLLDVSGGERPSGAFGLHIETMWRSGTIDLRAGPMLAASDTLRITVRGRGGHASAPHNALDPITVAAEIMLALQTMVSRRINVSDPAVITIGQIHGGTTTNIIPATVSMGGTMRTISEANRLALRANVRQVAAGIAAAHGAAVDVEIEPGYPVTVNDPAFTRLVLDAARDVLGDDDVEEVAAPIMGAEDFSYVLQQVPGAFAFVGARPVSEDPATAPMNHSNRVVFDEEALAVGVATHVAVALRHLTAR
jgi:hippurate hydrolase